MATEGANAAVTTALQAPPVPDVADDNRPIVQPPWPFIYRMRIAARLWLLKAFVFFGLGFLRLSSRKRFRAIAPTYEKAYPVRPSLKCRVFLPKGYMPGSKLALYIDIHGGGYALCDPQTDDHFCRRFADRYHFCVVSINYRKAPRYPWPLPVEDCAEIARAVLQDPDLPVDHDKVVMGGFSAGGNLCLAIAQLDGIRDKIKGLIPFYPSVDFSARFRGEFKTTPSGKADMLQHSARLFNWAYVPAGTDRREKLLSVIYATRTDLPQKMYFIGAEYDMLCHEANIMAKKLAGIDSEEDLGPEWDKNGIRWEMVPDLQHGFTHVPGRGAEGEKRSKICEQLYERINEWIQNEVF